MQQQGIAVPVLEEMLRSFPGETWALAHASGDIAYVVGEEAPANVHIADLAHPDDATRVLDLFATAVSTPRVPHVERVRLSRPDGSCRSCDVTIVNRLDDPAVRAVVIRAVEAHEPPALPDDLVESLAEAVASPVLVADQSGFVVISNSAARTLLGDEFGHVSAQLAGARSQGTTRLTFELGRRWIHARISQRGDGWVAMLDDVTADSHGEDEIVRLAMTDQLTGLANRAAFDVKLSEVLAAADDMPVSLVFVDLDGFKRVNDQHGHAAGDQVLKVVAARLKRAVRPGDVVARTGTHEFGMICPGLSAEHAPPFAERLGDTIRERMNVGSARVVVGAVVGTATSPPLELDATSLTATIDKAMRRDTTIMAWMPDVEL